MKLKTIRTILQHPLTTDRRLAALGRFLKRGVMVRLHRQPIVYPFVDGTFLVVERGMSSAELQIYTHLYDFGEMAFLLHYLRASEDVFVDVGANVGVYTVLTAGVAGVPVVSVEPVPTTFRKLERNVLYNLLQHRVTLCNMGVGDEEGYLKFTSDLDAVNHVVRDANEQTNTVSVRATTLDVLLADQKATCFKIDVEGFEANVINGASTILARGQVQVVIMETNGLSDQYAFGQHYLHERLLSYGFLPCAYNPFLRKIVVLERPAEANTIYIRDTTAAGVRVSNGPPFTVDGRRF